MSSIDRLTIDIDGAVRMGPGTLYGTLNRLVADGLIIETTDHVERGESERRRYYELTHGRAATVALAELGPESDRLWCTGATASPGWRGSGVSGERAGGLRLSAWLQCGCTRSRVPLTSTAPTWWRLLREQ